MGDEIKVDTEQVLQISADIQRKNIERNQKLMEACTEILGLGNDGWKGSGAEAFFSGFRSFSSDYFPRHYENIHVYTEFLRKNVAHGYTDAEKRSAELADLFKD